MFDVLVTVLAALLSLPDLAQEHVTLTLPAVLVQVALTLPLVVRRVWPSAVFGRRSCDYLAACMARASTAGAAAWHHG